MTNHQHGYRIFANSLPKSGTFLLSLALELFGYRDHGEPEREEATPIYLNYRKARNAMSRRSPNTSGLPWRPG